MARLKTVRDAGEWIVHAIEAQRWLDKPSQKIEHAVALVFNLLGAAGKPAQGLLHGTWLGHPLHPLLTDLPVGAWTTALVLDGVDAVAPDAKGFRDAAQLAVGVGVVGGAGAAVAGLTDWQYTHDNARRAGLVHGALNAAALGLYAMSWRDRRRGRQARGRLLSTVGFGAATCSAYLGGTLVYRHRVGVDHADEHLEPRDFVPVLAADALEEDVPRRMPYGEGWVYRDAIVCPWHGSQFDLPSGLPVRGPATAPLPCFETRVRDGQVEVRRVPPVRSADPGAVLGAGGSR